MVAPLKTLQPPSRTVARPARPGRSSRYSCAPLARASDLSEVSRPARTLAEARQRTRVNEQHHWSELSSRQQDLGDFGGFAEPPSVEQRAQISQHQARRQRVIERNLGKRRWRMGANVTDRDLEPQYCVFYPQGLDGGGSLEARDQSPSLSGHPRRARRLAWRRTAEKSSSNKGPCLSEKYRSLTARLEATNFR